MKPKGALTSTSATRAVSSTLGVLVGLAGIEHGYFEFLQGDVRPNGVMIDAIGPAQRFWEYGTETALTIVPNFLVSGILAMILGLLVVIWAYGFVHRKFGAAVLLLLSIVLFLVGGGFAPIFLTILAFVAATRINKPLKWWQSRNSKSIRNLSEKLWPWTLIASVLLFVIAVETAIFGYPLLWVLGPDTTSSVQFSLGLAILLLSIMSLPAAFAHDAQRQVDPTH